MISNPFTAAGCRTGLLQADDIPAADVQLKERKNEKIKEICIKEGSFKVKEIISTDFGRV